MVIQAFYGLRIIHVFSIIVECVFSFDNQDCLGSRSDLLSKMEVIIARIIGKVNGIAQKSKNFGQLKLLVHSEVDPIIEMTLPTMLTAGLIDVADLFSLLNPELFQGDVFYREGCRLCGSLRRAAGWRLSKALSLTHSPSAHGKRIKPVLRIVADRIRKFGDEILGKFHTRLDVLSPNNVLHEPSFQPTGDS